MSDAEYLGLTANRLARIASDLDAKNAKLRKQAARLFDKTLELGTENAALREQMERLVTLLRNDCDIDASWDGLRRFWSIELTEGGCLMRDRACKAEAENARLRAMRDTWAENDAKLRELVRAAYNCANTGPNCLECRIVAGGCTLLSAMRELGVDDV